MEKATTHQVETEVLVIGGGTAGCLAAMAARREGKSVTIVEKGSSISHSGSLATGVDHYSAILGEAPWDTPEAFIDKFKANRTGLNDIKLVEIYARAAKAVFGYLENIGLPFKDAKTGTYFRIVGMGGSEPRTICFEGGRMKAIFRNQLSSLGVNIIERVAMKGLLTDSGRVTGAVGFHIRNGIFHIFKAKSVVVTTGGATRLFPAATGRTFFTHAPPYNTGDGHAMAFNAGAILTNMEFPSCSVSPKGTDGPALTGLIGMGGFFINGLGEEFMKKYHPFGNHAPKNVVINGMLKEFAAGRGPCYVDCRHIDKAAIDRIIKGILNERPTLLDYLQHKGIEIGRDPIPFELREMEICGQGIKIDESCASSLEGLYAAGDCTNIGLAVSGACTLGYLAGKNAAQYSSSVPGYDANTAQISQLRKNIYCSLNNEGFIRSSDLEDEVRRIMSAHVGFNRNEVGLQAAISALRSLKENARHMIALSYHELMRANETQNLIDMSLVIARAALERRESRSIPAHYRSDYPKQDDGKWRGFILMKKGHSGEMKVSYAPLCTS